MGEHSLFAEILELSKGSNVKRVTIGSMTVEFYSSSHSSAESIEADKDNIQYVDPIDEQEYEEAKKDEFDADYLLNNAPQPLF